MDIYSVYITASNSDEAKAVGKMLVESKLAACVNIYSPVNSIYWWNGKVEQGDEAVLIAKTTGDKITALEEKVKKIHSYECPCIVSHKIDRGNEDYLKWVKDSVK